MSLKKLTIEKMQECAEKKKGECLSKKYINLITPLRWRCNKGHEWNTTPKSIMNGNWCRLCSNSKNKNYGNKKTTIEEINRIAENKGGMFISNNYYKYTIDGKIAKQKWQCKEGHYFEMRLNHVKSGHWCPYCAGLAKLTLEQMQCIAKERGGKCLSKEYINAYSKLKWQCKKGHEWMATPGSIKFLHWCPYCTEKKTERYCRQIFEEIFENKFEKKRHRWLIYKRHPLELDGFNNTIITPIGRGLAFEYNGKQHYHLCKFFHKECSLYELKKHDFFKSKKCKEKGIILIVIPYTIERTQIRKYILQEIKNNNISLNNIN